MGYAFNGQCYPDTTTALDAFKVQANKFDSLGMVSLTNVPTISGTGVINYTASTVAFSSGTVKPSNGNFTLASCTYAADDKFGLLAQQDVLVAVGIGLAFLVGIVAGNTR